LLRGGLVVVDADTMVVRRVIALQYNPDTLTRTLQVQGIGAETGDRLEVLRLKAPPVETFRMEAEIDATDQLAAPDRNPRAVRHGIQPQLAALETLLYPAAAVIHREMALALSGVMEIAPVEEPLLLFVWGRSRIVPVRLTEFSVAEEMFDTSLNPIRAKVTLTLRVLSVNDFTPTHRGAALYLGYQEQKERLAALRPDSALGALGIERLL
jgi:hypothetical protein